MNQDNAGWTGRLHTLSMTTRRVGNLLWASLAKVTMICEINETLRPLRLALRDFLAEANFAAGYFHFQNLGSIIPNRKTQSSHLKKNLTN